MEELPELQAVGVLGPIARAQLGAVLASEHIVAALRGLGAPSDDVLACAPMSMANLGSVRHAPLSCAANLDLADGGEAADELRSMESRRAGLSTLLDCTSIGAGRDPAMLREIAHGCRRLRVILSTGHGSERHGLPGWLRGASEEEIAALMLRELSEGVDGTGGSGEPAVRAGAITAGVSSLPTALELKLLRAAAIASRRSLAPIFVQLAAFAEPEDGLPLQLLAELEGAGAAPSRVCFVLSGLALTLALRDVVCSPLIEAARRGVFVCVAGLGMPDVWLPAETGAPVHLPHDGEIANAVCRLLQAGLGEQLLLSTGVRMRLQRERYGGGGYGHCRDFFVPLLRAGGVAPDALRALTEINAARLLCWWKPPPPPRRSMRPWTCTWCVHVHDGPLHAHERLAEDQMFYDKGDHRYCSTACLSAHRQAGFGPTPAPGGK
ncbi:hypothetical protein T492DRAFT_946342 [Pavlovales sp. CCMP2436]|nr:hypothetical protein T492DRAFT_946342 [Pavlovales sp. CCMP2436]